MSYILLINNQEHGPYSIESLIEGINRGKIKADTMARHSDSGEWWEVSAIIYIHQKKHKIIKNELLIESSKKNLRKQSETETPQIQLPETGRQIDKHNYFTHFRLVILTYFKSLVFRILILLCLASSIAVLFALRSSDTRITNENLKNVFDALGKTNDDLKKVLYNSDKVFMSLGENASDLLINPTGKIASFDNQAKIFQSQINSISSDISKLQKRVISQNNSTAALESLTQTLISLGILPIFEPNVTVMTLAGSSLGYADGPGNSASFSSPAGVSLDGSGNVYVADTSNHRIRKISPSGEVITLAGSGSSAFADGQGTSASFDAPSGIAVDGSGNVYVADTSNHRIRKISPSGEVITLAGSGSSAFADGQGTSASFDAPSGIAVDGSGNVYVADMKNCRIRRISPSGLVTTLAGSWTASSADGQRSSASFYFPLGVAVDGSGNIYVATNNRVRKITASGLVTTLAGSVSGEFADGQGDSANFNQPYGVAVDASGNVYVADSGNHRIHKISANGTFKKQADWDSKGFDDGQGTSARFNIPHGVSVDGSGNVYVADQDNNRIRKITAGGGVTTLAGSGSKAIADGQGTAAWFNGPTGVAVDGSGNVYVADSGNHRIRKITPSGLVSTLAGSWRESSADGHGIAAGFNGPTGVAVDGSGNVYVADQYNNSIRKISAGGLVTTLAGARNEGYAEGQGTAARFNGPTGVAVDGSGNVYVADQHNHRIRKITPSGLVSTLAGSGSGEFADGQGISAHFKSPRGVAVDRSGNVYVADSGNHRIRRISPSGLVTTLAGSGIKGSNDGLRTSASFRYPSGVAVDGSGNVYVADQYNHRISKISANGNVTTLAGSVASK
jgi:sugar lactone lactonase YvrE